MNELLILSYANKENINSINYINSLKKYKYNYKIVGNSEVWVNFITKIKACYNYLITENKYNLICLTDNYDVLCCGPKQELINKFKTFNKDIVFSTENNCVKGQCIYLNNYYKNNNKKLLYPYLNAGFYMGKKDKIIELLKFILNTSNKTGIVDDQLLCCLYVQQFPNNVALDNDCKLIGTICYNVFDYKWYNNRVYNIKTKQNCVFLHSPCINADFSRRLDYYGKRILKTYKKENFIKKLKNFYKHVKSSNLKLYFIVGFLILLIIFYFNRKIGFLILIFLIVFLIRII